MNKPLWQLDIADMLSAYQSQTDGITPLTVCESLLEQVAHHEATFNTLACANENLLSAAAQSTERWKNGTPSGPLDGVPLIIKDNLLAAGLPASWGNALLAARAVDRDELPIERLRAAGALIVGKANTPEFAVDGFTASDHFGVTRNPFDPVRTPGGSSGGVVAAIASGFAPAGIATDGGGSIRRPAGYCGLVGLKPGLGHVPRADGLPQVLLDMETVGPIARSVRDVALLDEVLAGPDRRDFNSCHYPESGFADTPRVLLIPRFGEAPCDPAIIAATNKVARKLEALGCDVKESADLPLPIERLNAHWATLPEVGLAQLFEADPELAASASDRYVKMASRGTRRTVLALHQLISEIAALRHGASLLFADWDIILTPTSAAMPWQADRPFPTAIGGKPVSPRAHAVYTGWVNAIGHPALAMPAPVPDEKMPVGVQLVGDRGSERALLQLGAAIEAESLTWRWPKIVSEHLKKGIHRLPPTSDQKPVRILH